MSREAEERADLLLVCTPGGHLQELFALREAWAPFSRAWVTFAYGDAKTLLRDERVYFAKRQRPRRLRNVITNFVFAWRLIGRLRPKALLTTGAQIAVPMAWAARFRGVRVVFVESATRIHKPSLSCRLIAPIADRIYVQWPELLRALPRARYAGNVVWPEG